MSAQEKKEVIETVNTTIPSNNTARTISAKIESIDYQGQMSILFSQNMNVNFSKDLINQDHISIYINKTQTLPPEIRNTELEWEVDSFHLKALKINMTFAETH